MAWFPVQGSRVRSVGCIQNPSQGVSYPTLHSILGNHFFPGLMEHNLAESIVAMWPSLEPFSRGEGSQAIM